MPPPVTGVPPELKGLPQAALDAIHAACAGDWRRVEIHSTGVPGQLEFTIHNEPQMRRVELPPAGSTKKRMREKATESSSPSHRA